MGTLEECIRQLRCRLELTLGFVSSDHPQAGELVEDIAHRGMVADKYDSVPWKLGDIGATLKQIYPDATSMLRANHRYAEYTLRVCEFQGSWFVLRRHCGEVSDEKIQSFTPDKRARAYDWLLATATPEEVSFLSERADAVSALKEYEKRNR